MAQTSKIARILLFARNFLSHPRMLGSVIPSSRYLIDQMLDQVDWERARVIVEYGPGVGPFTAEILDRLHPEGTLIALETNEDFVEFLEESYDDARFKVVHTSAAEVGKVLDRLGLGRADYILSGIPFSTIPAPIREEILSATQAALVPDGKFLVYQFSGRVGPDLENHFQEVERAFEPRNIPPARLFYCSA